LETFKYASNRVDGQIIDFSMGSKNNQVCLQSGSGKREKNQMKNTKREREKLKEAGQSGIRVK
jgi:hypothetical protein